MIGRRVGRRVEGEKPEIYLYNAGDKCIPVTGGFTFTKTGGDTGAITYGSTSFIIQLPYPSSYRFETINNINFPSYSKINIIYEKINSLGSHAQWSIPTVADIFLNGQVVIPSPACITKTYNNEKFNFNIANLKSAFLRINQIWLS